MTVHRGGAPLSIAGGVREFARATPRATAVIDGDRMLTYAALDERSSRLACSLLASGLTAGQRVAVLMGNRLEYPEIAAGIAKAGLVMVPLNPRLTASEARFILEHSGARAIVLDDALSLIVGDAIEELGLISLSIDGARPAGRTRRRWRRRGRWIPPHGSTSSIHSASPTPRARRDGPRAC